jgi:hypothetical protein
MYDLLEMIRKQDADRSVAFLRDEFKMFLRLIEQRR